MQQTLRLEVGPESRGNAGFEDLGVAPHLFSVHPG